MCIHMHIKLYICIFVYIHPYQVCISDTYILANIYNIIYIILLYIYIYVCEEIIYRPYILLKNPVKLSYNSDYRAI